MIQLINNEYGKTPPHTHMHTHHHHQQQPISMGVLDYEFSMKQ